MADDPDRDILPVKEGSCADSCRSNIDPRERHIVGKLDRCELEDKYLRLLEEAHNLKKLANRQEDKIKRLATKLMRATANPKSCPASLDVYDNKNKIIALEIENAKLKDKIVVLRNQLLSHTISGRSSSRSRNQVRPSSGRITCRSENSRTKITCSYVENGNNETANENNETANGRNSLYKIEELEMEKEEMSSRIAQLEKELSASTVVSQREKIAENIKYIQVWRQMKQLNDKLIDAEQENESLNEQINDLKRLLEEATKSNEAIAVDLIAERKRLDEEITRGRNSVLSLREKDEQIKDLVNEVKILQDHNHELIELSNKYGEVEMENMQLKKKLDERHDEEENLRTSFNDEQANIVALQASNEQLLGKLQELQKNIDSLTSFPTQTEKEEISQETQITMKSEVKKMESREPYKDNFSQVEECSKCCFEAEKKSEQDIAERVEQCKKCCMVAVPLGDVMHSGRNGTRLVDNSVQTDYDAHLIERKEQETGSVMTPVKEMPEKQESQIAKKSVSRQMMTDGSALTPDKMLKLLDQAQIAGHVDAQRIPQRTVVAGVEYSEPLDQYGRHSGTETLVQATQEIPQFQPKPQPQDVPKSTSFPQSDSTKLLSLFYNILHEYNQSTSPHEIPTLYRPIVKQQYTKDVNNNLETAEIPARVGCSMRKCCSVPYNKFRQDKTKKKMVRRQEQIPVQNGIDDCTCTSSMRCPPDAACKMHCCGPPKSVRCYPETNHAVPQVGKDASVDNIFKDEYSQRPYGDFKLSRRLTPECGGCENPSEKVANSVTYSDETLHEYVKRLDKCREIMHGVADISAESPLDRMKIPNQLRSQPGVKASKLIRRETGSFCSLECTNDCADMTSPAQPDSSPLIITDGQGLVELHIMSLQLSTCAKEILFREKDLNDVLLFVSWDIWNQETAYTPTLKCPKLNFNSSFVYRISDLFSFFNYVLSDLVIFEVNVFHEDRDNYVVARGKLSVKDILDYPQNKLHYIAPVNSVIPCSIGMSFGQLSLWVRLSCDVEKVVEFKKQRGIYTQICEDVKPPVPMPQRVVIAPKPEVIEKEEKLSATETISNTISDTIPSTIIEQISTYRDSAGELSSQITEMAVPVPPYRDDSSDTSGEVQLTKTRSVVHLGKDALTVVKESEEELERMYPDTNGAQVSSNNKPLYGNAAPWEETTTDETNDRNDTDNTNEKDKNKSKEPDPVNPDMFEFSDSVSDREEKDMISIEILNMILFPKSFIMQNPDLQLLYIEYCFLGYCGADMETVSLKKPEPPNQSLKFNFKRKFRVDDEKHSLQNNILRAMLDESTNPNIKFIVVCEPLPEDTDTKECVEVGYGQFNIREYALGDSEKVVSLPIYNANDASDKIGLLKISVLGLDTIRQRLGRRESDTH